VVKSAYCGCQPKTVCACFDSATKRAGSPTRRSPMITGICLLVTFSAISMISFTEKPAPLPKL